jgi:hypothetical protein
VRKILSIVLALAVVLSLSAVLTAPVAAKVTAPVVTLTPNACACSPSVYSITFNTTASLTEGVHSVCIAFPAGTTFNPYPGPAWNNDCITINGTKVFGSEITVTGTTVCFLVPKDFGAGPLTVIFTSTAGVTNPCTPGRYQLSVSTSRAPDSTPVLSNKYRIYPCLSSYSFVWDSNPTYPGIAEDFVPPFKAGGQANNATLGITGAVPFSGGYLNAFNLTFGYEGYAGCYAPCATVDIYVSLTAAPQFTCPAHATVTLNLTNATNSSWSKNMTLTWNPPCQDVSSDGVPDKIKIAAAVPLTASFATTWAGLIGFDTVGAYTICFSAVCPGSAAVNCGPGAGAPSTLAERCIDFNVYQDKDAHKIILDEKWNLISLPLVPFNTDIDTILSAADLDHNLDGVSDLISIWHYDRCTDTWGMYPGGGLTDMVDGDSYWVRMIYPTDSYTLWVFGTAKAMPPAAPLAYPMCPGWNMFGFTEMTTMTLGGSGSGYLWNFGGSGEPTLPLVYGWNNTGTWTSSGWLLVGSASNLVPGQGYWGYFPSGGIVVPP